MSDTTANKLPRKAKGKRPQYFDDPAVDKLHLMLMAVIEELSVSKDRIDTIERLIENKGLFKREKIEQFKPDIKAEQERTKKRLEYINRIMRSIIHDQEKTSDHTEELEFDQVVKIVSK